MKDIKKHRGLFIVFEGVDGCGKTTQAARFADWLEETIGKKVIRTAEPFTFRELILGRKDLSSMSELLLFLADRAEHVNKIILPAINAGINVVCERYNDSTLAYQVGGHGVEVSKVKNLIDSCNFPNPDAKVFLDLSPKTAFDRVKERNKLKKIKTEDKFEAEGFNLLKKVSDFYRTLQDLIRIPCDDLDEDEIFQHILVGVLGNGAYL